MPDSSLPNFNELHFGEIDASQEASETPELLTRGYYDFREAAYGLQTGGVWVLLGPKGSGKSAVLENIRLTWRHDARRFYSAWDLSGFPVNDVTRIPMGQTAGASRSQAAWEFLLLLHIVGSLAEDQGLTAPTSFNAMVKGLRKEGLLSGNWTSRVANWSSMTLKFDAKIFGAERSYSSDVITPLEASAHIRSVLSEVRTESRYMIALDGLDSFFFEADDEWTSLAGLVQAVYGINTEMTQLELPVTIAAAMRSDIIDVLPGPNVNKVKSKAIYLDWHARGIGANNHLWQLLSNKAAVSRPVVRNIVNQYLKTPVSIGPHTDLAEYFLDNTRLLPRDAVALMGYVQRFYKGNKGVTEHAAKNAVRAYAEEYFVGEIFDNLAGILPSARAREIASFKEALRTAPSRFFTFDYLKKELSGELDPADIKKLLKQMFEVGGIAVRNGGYTDFVFRRVSGAGFSTRYEFLLHDALTRAWNRPWR
jgi:hypothetical protein